MNIRKILVNIRNNAQQKAVMVVDRTAKHNYCNEGPYINVICEQVETLYKLIVYTS